MKLRPRRRRLGSITSGSPRRSNLILIKKIYKYGLACTVAAAQHWLLFFRKYEIQFSIRPDYTETACSTLSRIPLPTISHIAIARHLSAECTFENIISEREKLTFCRMCEISDRHIRHVSSKVASLRDYEIAYD